MHAPDAIWHALHQRRPQAARLALLTCLPVRVTPSFLRLARLRLVGEAGTGDEADLWLSDLVETRSSAGLSYRRAVRVAMREQLAAEPALLAAVWTQVHREHAQWLAPRARLEEELTWRLMRDPDDPWIEDCWRSVLQELDNSPNAEGVARWVVRATPDLPPGAQDAESGRRAFQIASVMLGDASVLGHEVQTFLDTQLFAFATRRLPRRRIHVGRVEEGLLISPLRPIENGFELDIPATRPLWLQIEAGTEHPKFAPQVITLNDHEPVTCETGVNSVSVRLIDGSAFAIGPPHDSANKFIRRNLTPRVQIEYVTEFYGSRKKVQLPFVTGVLADLSGLRGEPLPEVGARKFLDIDFENFDARMKAIGPQVSFQIADAVSGADSMWVRMSFESIDDFGASRVLQKVDWLGGSLEERRHLEQLSKAAEQSKEIRELLQRILGDMTVAERLNDSRHMGVKARQTLIRQAAGKHWPQEPALRRLLETALTTFGMHVMLASSPEQDVHAAIDSMIAAFDKKLSFQLSLVLHHPDFLKLESTWRGLHYLVNNTETDEMLKIRVLNISKSELGDTLDQFRGEQWDQSPIFKLVYEHAYEQLGGEPFGCLVGDFYFDHGPLDVALLGDIAKIASAAFAPFIAGASPSLVQMESWRELSNPRDLSKYFSLPEYAAWNSLRESENARFIGLTLPRFLARLPYGSKTNPIAEFAFEEEIEGDTATQYAWINAAYAMARNIHRAFTLYGWCTRICGVESGGAVDSLPVCVFPAEGGGLATMGPTEGTISERREAELAKNGLMPMVHIKGSDTTAFFGAQSLMKPREYNDPGATANVLLGARWPQLFGVWRFSHYLKCMVRDKVGGLADAEQTSRYLTDWILNYVNGDPRVSSESALAERPLAGAEIVVEEIADRPEYYSATFFLKPYHQLDGLSVGLRMVTRLPSGKAA